MANEVYTTNFMRMLFEEEGGDLFDVRQAILGHMQQGGTPSPFDRIFATRLGVNCIDTLVDYIERRETVGLCIGQVRGEVSFTHLDDVPRLMDYEHSRPVRQWWMDLRPIANLLARQGYSLTGEGETAE